MDQRRGRQRRLSLPEGLGPASSQKKKRQPAHYLLEIQFEQRQESDPLGWLAEATVWVNSAHPAYQRAVASRAEGYHLAVVVGVVLAPLAVRPPEAHQFLERFLARWGEGSNGQHRRGSCRARGGVPRVGAFPATAVIPKERQSRWGGST